MCKCRSHGTFPLFGLQSSHLNICYYHQDLHRRPLRPGSRPGFCSDRRALLLIGAWRLPRRPGIGRALQRHPFSGLVDSAVSLRTSTRVSSGFAPLRHSSPSFGSRQACSHSNPSQKIKVGRRCNPRGDPASQLPCALRVYSPVDSHTCQTPWSVFQDRDDGVSTGVSKARALAATAIRIGPRPEPIGGPAVTVPHPTGAHRRPPIHFPPDNFKHSLTLFSKSFSSFPRGTCLLSVSRPYLALDGIYRPIGAAFPNNPTRRQRLVVRQGPATTGLSPSPAPLSRGLGPGPPLRTLLQTTIRTPQAPDSQAGHFPRVVPPDLGSQREHPRNSMPEGPGDPGGDRRPSPRVSQPPLVVATVAEDSILGQPRAGARGRPVSAPALVSRGERGRRCVTPRQTCPRPGGLGRNLRSKTRWFTGFCNSHQVSHFATFFIDARAEISVAESRLDYHQKKARPRRRGYGGALLVLNFLGASSAGVRLRAAQGADASLHGPRGREGRVPPEPSLSCHGFAGRSARGRFRQ
uniref:Protein TAR1 n=1 Tax=Populus alba TaxID=43335 RepID=A0A4U5PMF1_POPAL|nr:hypothetical protein D5086_0000209830 [Populus alba]